MTMTAVGGREVHVDTEGFLTDPQEWDEALARSFATNIGLELTDAHWAAIRFARSDFEATGETPTLRRMATTGGVSTKDMFALFPKKPAKKLAYVAGLPKPVGCV
ncbi:MAG TPA: TusE/DsrC/DsvC family sulfur relay protein [Acidimicrobiia bacterium]|jgi:tRNA 2-thiouridine synthesizing protein E|nr:TusE/DsrC/DsvC family sulfur relay protein [Acidimicrobiia bacterium]